MKNYYHITIPTEAMVSAIDYSQSLHDGWSGVVVTLENGNRSGINPISGLTGDYVVGRIVPSREVPTKMQIITQDEEVAMSIALRFGNERITESDSPEF